MKLNEVVLNEEIDDVAWTQIKSTLKSMNKADLDKVIKLAGKYNKIKTDVAFWLMKQIDAFRVPQNKLLKKENAKYYIDMIKASNYTAALFEVPSMATLLKHMPEDIQKEIAEYFDSYSQNEILSEIRNIISEFEDFNSRWLGKECWNWQLFNKTYVNDEMKKVYNERGNKS